MEGFLRQNNTKENPKKIKDVERVFYFFENFLGGLNSTKKVLQKRECSSQEKLETRC